MLATTKYSHTHKKNTDWYTNNTTHENYTTTTQDLNSPWRNTLTNEGTARLDAVPGFG